MKRLSTLLFALVALFAIVGCGGTSEKELVGFWLQEYEDPQQKDIAEMAARMAGPGATGTQMSLDLKKDKTFMFAVGGSASIGTWKLKDQKLILKYTDRKDSALGSGNSVELDLSENGKQLSFPLEGGSGEKLLFEKSDF